MKLILNIGLDVTASAPIAAHVALEIVKANGFIVSSHKVVQSDTEPTLVVEAIVADNLSLEHGCYQTAVELRQDCIAVYVPLWRYGRLVGPCAAAWGQFNPEFFILPSGKRLAQPSKAV
jgi:hypothetical protein